MASTNERMPSIDSSPEPPEEAEAIVVGSGFGGAVAACRLAQAGIQVVVLERGRRYEAGDFPPLPTDSSLLPDFTRWSWPLGQGLWDIVDLEEMVSVQAAGYGGGSLIYGNVHLRPPRSVFDDKWPDAYHLGTQLEEFYDLAASMLDVAPIDSHADLAKTLIKPDQMKRVACHLGREDGFFHPPLALSFRDGPNIHGKQQKKCTGCGACFTGCPVTAKNSLDFNYLAVAENRGARVVTLCEVVEIDRRDDGAWLLTCVDHLTPRRPTFRSRNVFLCAGSIQSTRLLARARLGSSGKQAQSLVGIGYFANADALGVVYDTTHPQHPSFGPAITTSTVFWEQGDQSSFFLVQDGGYAPELDRLVGVLRGAAWLGRNRHTRPGTALVDPSKLPPPPVPQPKDVGLALASPLDDVLVAIAGGAYKDVLSDETRREWSTLLGEIRELLILPAIVDRTIELSVLERLKRCWLTSWLRSDGWAGRAIVRLSRWLVRVALGRSEVLADRALRAMLNGANLGRADIARRMLGYGGEKPEHRVMLLAMGRDAKPGQLHYDAALDRLIADMDLFHLFPRYTNEEQAMSDVGRALGGELRTNPAWAFLGKPISSHNQGGCPMSEDPTMGVTAPDGQVHGCEGLHVLDAATFCTSVGVNPSATILAIAERNIREFIRRNKKNYPLWPAGDASAGALEYKSHLDRARKWATMAQENNWTLRPPPDPSDSNPFKSEPLGLGFNEVMEGYYAPTRDRPSTEREYRTREAQGRPAFPIRLSLDVSTENLARFMEDCRHRMELAGFVTMRLPDEPQAAPYACYPVSGHLDLFVRRRKAYGIRKSQNNRRSAQERLLGSSYTTVVAPPRRGQRRRMTYELSFTDKLGRPWRIKGYKSIRDDPGMDAWRHTSSLFVRLLGPGRDGTGPNGHPPNPVIRGAGVVHVDLGDFLHYQLPSMRITPKGVDPARAMWARLKFAAFFFGTLQRIYLPEVRTALEGLISINPSNILREAPRV